MHLQVRPLETSCARLSEGITPAWLVKFDALEPAWDRQRLGAQLKHRLKLLKPECPLFEKWIQSHNDQEMPVDQHQTKTNSLLRACASWVPRARSEISSSSLG